MTSVFLFCTGLFAYVMIVGLKSKSDKKNK